MNRRKFIRLMAAMPLLAVNIKAQAKDQSTLLLQTNVAGFRYYEGQRIWSGLDTNRPLILSREPHNPYDDKAIAIYWKSEKLGYIPRENNTVIANIIDQGLKVRALIHEKRKTAHPWERLCVRVEMIS